MNQIVKKFILLSTELSSSEVGAFFQDQGFELHQSYTEGVDYSFIVDNTSPDIKSFPRLQITEEINPDLAPLVKSRINAQMFESEHGKKLLTSYFHDGLEFDLIDRYSKDLKNVYTVKIHEYLNVGYFVDSIVVEAYKAKFDINALRNYLNIALNFAFKKLEGNFSPMPIDVSYAHNGDAFTVQISLSCDQFAGEKEFGKSFSELMENTNYFDATYFHKSKRLTLSNLIFRMPELKETRAYFFTEVLSRTYTIGAEVHEPDIYSGLVFNEPVAYVAPKVMIEDAATQLVIARKFAHFIKEFRRLEIPPVALGRLDLTDVINYLAHYPKQEELQELNPVIKKFIFKLLKNEGLFHSVDQFMQKIAESHPHGQIREIQNIFGERGLEDIEEILQIKPSSYEGQYVTTVKASDENLSTDVQRISGDNESLSDNDLWEVRKLQLNMRDQGDGAMRVRGHSPSNDNDVTRIKGQASLPENDAMVVKGEAAPSAEEAEDILNGKKLEEEFFKKIVGQQSPDPVREKLESQIARMKKIMEPLKKELQKLQAEKAAREESEKNASNTHTLEMLQMKNSLERTMEAIKHKDHAIEKIKKDADQAIKNRELKIDFLEQKIANIKADYSKSREFANEEKLEQLEAENKTLNLRLELANKKVNIISENISRDTEIDKRDKESSGKREKEVESMKANMLIAQTVIERLKLDKIEMEARLSADKEIIRKLKEDRLSAPKTGNPIDDEKDGIIQVLNGERKIMEEKYRLQSIELKKLEQKLKYTLSQLESLSKKKAAASNPKSNDAYAKQLDLASARLAEATAEIGEKRREIIKLKQENSLISNKIAELEKKLSLLDKKVA